MTLASVAGAEPPVPETVEFNRDVRPILSENCFKCHGFDAKERKAERRLDTREGALAEAKGVRGIVPGKLEESESWLRIVSDDAEEQMPPPKSGKHLTERNKAVLKRWIEQGAAYQDHWAYLAPVKAALPEGQDPIDFLVGERLREVGLAPSPEADRRALIRRLSFDLCGVPPSPAEAEAFAADESPGAWAALIDRLLASQRYGERMATPWLDVVRYADTIGYHSDNPRNVWPYRDYVIRAFNDNKPFDRFTIEQVAGDLLPGSTPEQKVASCFNRLVLSTEEGGAQAKDYEVRMLTDRVRAIGTVFLGATIGCSQCHDHKFDPITQRDFYAMGAFFADLKEQAIGKLEPGMELPTPAQSARRAEWQGRVAEAKQETERAVPGLEAEALAWQAGLEHAATEKFSKELKAAVALPAVFQSAAQRQLVLEKYREVAPELAESARKLKEAEAGLKESEEAIPKCLVSIHAEKPRPVRILARGNWMDESGELVQPALPHFLPGAAEAAGKPLTRLDLGEWLVSRQNPLTARVFVNRVWKQFFGMGLSKVLDDLGAQGEPPVNPALLDWLAADFMDSGWDVKHLVRTIVRSATYRQVSTASKEGQTRDPYNRELARQSRWRLDSEMVRDNALAVSGLLTGTVGGPSVKPYQPDGYWENLNFPVRTYDNSGGAEQYRRGLYTWWQRSYTHPSMLAFDAPTREECTAERVRSNIPQQALVLLNDPTYVEAARVFAGHILARPESERLGWAFAQALQRAPRPDETEALTALLGRELGEYRADAAAAAALGKVGQHPAPDHLDPAELAAWTNLARAIFSLHESVTRS